MLEKLAFHVSTPLNGAPLELDVVKTTSQSAIWPISLSAAARAGTPDEVASVAALLMGPDGGFITGSDFLMDGGVTAAYWYGDLA